MTYALRGRDIRLKIYIPSGGLEGRGCNNFAYFTQDRLREVYMDPVAAKDSVMFGV